MACSSDGHSVDEIPKILIDETEHENIIYCDLSDFEKCTDEVEDEEDGGQVN